MEGAEGTRRDGKAVPGTVVPPCLRIICVVIVYNTIQIMLSWFTRQITTTAVVPPPPPQPSRITAQNLDTLALLQRIDSKLDILLSKMDSTNREPRKKFPTVVIPPEVKVNEEVTDSEEKEHTTQPKGDFTKELFQRIEQLKHTKNMGVSHGFF